MFPNTLKMKKKKKTFEYMIFSDNKTGVNCLRQHFSKFICTKSFLKSNYYNRKMQNKLSYCQSNREG